MNFDKRDRIIFGNPYDPDQYTNGIRYFKNLRRHEVRALLDSKLLNIYPWVQYAEFWWFMEQFGNDNELYLHGFVYSKERKDGCGDIIIEGIGRDKKFESVEAEKVFSYLFHDADQFELDPPWVWYD